jgi:AraC-like DNA-binding protein
VSGHEVTLFTKGNMDIKKQRMPKTYMELFLKWAGNRVVSTGDVAHYFPPVDEFDGMMSLDDVYKSLLSLNPKLMEPLWHIHWAAWIRGRFHGPLTLALLNAPDLETGLTTACRYLPIRLPYLEFNVVAGDERFSIGIEVPQAPEQIRLELVEVPLYLIFEYVSSFATVDMSQVNVSLQRTSSPHAQEYREWFGASLDFGAHTNLLSIPKSWLSIKNPEYDAGAWNLAIAKCDGLAPKTGDGSEAAEYVRLALSAAADSGTPIGEMPGINELAEHLYISARTMIRQLRREGTSYQQIINDIQKSRAVEFLKITELTISDVAARLGYADPANFGRAFRRWFGVSPGKFRDSIARS